MRQKKLHSVAVGNLASLRFAPFARLPSGFREGLSENTVVPVGAGQSIDRIEREGPHVGGVVGATHYFLN